MNTKYNKWFEQTVADPVRRRAAIADFTKRRIFLFLCASAVTICALLILVVGTRHSAADILLLIGASFSWIGVGRISSQLHKLERADQISGEKPSA
jgi:hypothetical protein